MNASVALSSGFPVPNDFRQPFGMVTSWPSSDHRNAQRVLRDATVIISQLEFVAALRPNIEIGKKANGEAFSDTQAERDEAMLELLQWMRTLHAELQGGLHIRRICRDVERYTPTLKVRLAKSIDAAVEQLTQMRASLAFLTGEDDDADLGVELLPDAGAPLPPEDSRPPA